MEKITLITESGETLTIKKLNGKPFDFRTVVFEVGSLSLTPHDIRENFETPKIELCDREDECYATINMRSREDIHALNSFLYGVELANNLKAIRERSKGNSDGS